MKNLKYLLEKRTNATIFCGAINKTLNTRLNL